MAVESDAGDLRLPIEEIAFNCGRCRFRRFVCGWPQCPAEPYPLKEHGRHHIKTDTLVNGTFWNSPFSRRRNNRTVQSVKLYTRIGISHQEPSGQLFFGPLNRPSLMSLARKDGNSMLRYHALCGSQAALLHAILVDGMIERIEGRPELADAAVENQRQAGHMSAYLS